MGSLGWPEIIAILVIVLVIFGPKRLPEIGRSLGKGIKEFKKSTSELQDHLTKDDSEKPKVENVEAAQPAPAATLPVNATEPAAGPEPKQASESKQASEEQSTETKTS